MDDSPHLPAAVETDQAASVARVVPPGVRMVKAGGAVLGYRHKPARLSRGWSLAGQRLAEIERLIEHRHGGPVNTDDGLIYLDAALPHILAEGARHGAPIRRTNVLLWAGKWAPKVVEEETLARLDEIEREERERPRAIRADALAKMLQVTKAERSSLGLTTIGAIDWNRKDRQKARKQRDRERHAVERRAAGKRPQAESASKNKPWIADGFKSRRPWERHRRRQRDDATSSATLSAEKGPDDANKSATCNDENPGRAANKSTAIGLYPSCGTSCGTSAISVNVLISGARHDERSEVGPIGPTIVHAEHVVQADMFGSPPVSVETAAAVHGWSGGLVPPAICRLTLDTKRSRALRQIDVARQIGISRPQLANALRGRFGLSAPIAANLKAWLTTGAPA